MTRRRPALRSTYAWPGVSRHIVAVFLTLTGCGGPRVAASETYVVGHAVGAPIVVDGVLNDDAWKHATLETRFSFPWQKREPPPTEFRAVADDTHVYFAFRVTDTDVVESAADGEEAVARGDRVELFFATDSTLRDYACVEIGPSGRVLDYRAAFYREFDRGWDMPGLILATARTEPGYVVEGSIPHATFRDAGLPSLSDAGGMIVGIFRAEFSHSDNGAPREEWISWVRPATEQPDFHVPSAFGQFRLEAR